MERENECIANSEFSFLDRRSRSIASPASAIAQVTLRSVSQSRRQSHSAFLLLAYEFAAYLSCILLHHRHYPDHLAPGSGVRLFYIRLRPHHFLNRPIEY
jgi:hypothetical protein